MNRIFKSKCMCIAAFTALMILTSCVVRENSNKSSRASFMINEELSLMDYFPRDETDYGFLMINYEKAFESNGGSHFSAMRDIIENSDEIKNDGLYSYIRFGLASQCHGIVALERMPSEPNMEINKKIIPIKEMLLCRIRVCLRIKHSYIFLTNYGGCVFKTRAALRRASVADISRNLLYFVSFSSSEELNRQIQTTKLYFDSFM